MYVPDKTMKSILATLPSGQRREIAATLNGQITHKVSCVSKKCKGRLLGHVYADGKFRAVRNEKGEMWCKAYRHRLDGFMGFQCWCGNDSRMAKQEEGVFDYKGTVPDKAGMNKVFSRVLKDKPNYPVKSGQQIIDDFLLEEIK